MVACLHSLLESTLGLKPRKRRSRVGATKEAFALAAAAASSCTGLIITACWTSCSKTNATIIWVVVKMMDGPFLDPHYNTAPNIWGTPKRIIILTTTHITIKAWLRTWSFPRVEVDAALFPPVWCQRCLIPEPHRKRAKYCTPSAASPPPKDRTPVHLILHLPDLYKPSYIWYVHIHEKRSRHVYLLICPGLCTGEGMSRL